MQREDIEKLAHLPPQQRAHLLLTMGSELQEARTDTLQTGALPASLQRESVIAGVAGPMIQHLHGIKGALPRIVTGVRATGRTLNTRAGKVPDMVLTPRARKAHALIAMEDSQDQSDHDLAIRHCGLGMVDSDPVARCLPYQGRVRIIASADGRPH